MPDATPWGTGNKVPYAGVQAASEMEDDPQPIQVL